MASSVMVYIGAILASVAQNLFPTLMNGQGVKQQHSKMTSSGLACRWGRDITSSTTRAGVGE